MGGYLPSTAAEQQAMLHELHLPGLAALYADIPDSVKLSALHLPEGMSELSVRTELERLAECNTRFRTIFRGAGAYRHYIPAIVRSVTAKEAFTTAYTPYQAEISQGILQSIFEYQTMICELTGLDVANASVYDGATAAAEAALMCGERKRKHAVVSGAVAPQVIETMRTYCTSRGMELTVVPPVEGKTDAAALAALLDDTTACVCFQQPNYFGILEDGDALTAAAHAAGAKAVVSVNPIALGVIKTPGEYGADIAVGEGQPLGLPLSFGGPYLGFMACTKAMMRRLPGRIVGETTDDAGRRAFVLTLQAREQHIRREKASSNICSNEALCALTAGVYLSAMGADGLREVAEQCHDKAHYLAAELEKIGFALQYRKPFFHEFVTSCPMDTAALDKALAARGVLGGLPLDDGHLLWCATEMNTKTEIDALIQTLKEVCPQ